MPKPDSSLTFGLRTAALELWKMGLKGYASPPSHDLLKNNKFIEKFDLPIYSVLLAKNYQCVCYPTAGSQEPKRGRKHCATGNMGWQRAAAYFTWN